MKLLQFSVLVALAFSGEHQVNALRLGNNADVSVTRLDESTRRFVRTSSVQRAAAAALQVAVAAKKALSKAEAAESIKNDMAAVKKAEMDEAEDNVKDAIEKASRAEEKRAVEKAVAYVEKIRQEKLRLHQKALKEIENIKANAQKEHDEINRKTKRLTEEAIARATSGVLNLEN